MNTYALRQFMDMLDTTASLINVDDKTPAQTIHDLVGKVSTTAGYLSLHATKDVATTTAEIVAKWPLDRATSTDQRNLLRERAKALRENILSDSNRITVAVLRTGRVSSMIRSAKTLFANPPMSARQRIFHDEIIRTLEMEAYRSAIVMGWAFAYDRVTEWALPKKLEEFNQAMLTKAPKWKSVATHDELIRRPGSEYSILTALHDAKVISERPYDALKHYLRERNKYAHASEHHATMEKSNAYIQHLFELISGPPFDT